MTHFHRSLIIGCSALALAGCGADEIASPGTGGNISITNPPALPPTPTPTGTPTVVAAAGCPTINDPQGLTDEGTISVPTGSYRVCVLPSRFNTSSNLPYRAGLLYRIAGRVDVGTDGGPAPDASDGLSDTNVTLTLEPGAMVYASGSSFLMVNRGNRINAVGTSTRPIIFTSRDNVLGLNDDNSSGQWGGVVLAGRAPITDCIAPAAAPGSVNCERQVEGEAQPALFGGATPADSSGTMKFVQIRYSGFVLSGNNELQALTTGGTGSGTVLENIMSFNSSDDGAEFFGGIVNMKRFISVGAEDDNIDTDTGVKANFQYVIAVQRPGVGDTIIEADSTNAFNDSVPRQNTQISNATFIHNSATAASLVRQRGGTDYALVNTVMVSAANTVCLRIDDSETIRAANAGIDDLGPVRFNSVAMQCATPYRAGSNGVSLADTQGLFEAGTNNNASFTNSLTSIFINGARETAVTAFNARSLSLYFDTVNYIGAVKDSTDTWYQGWTCNSSTVSFGTNVGNCSSLPVY